ncbi:MAG: SP0191 family lipoprotein [Streptococcus sp.]|nr:SP0191 family lipoprotein [Streptococcus sp.]
MKKLFLMMSITLIFLTGCVFDSKKDTVKNTSNSSSTKLPSESSQNQEVVTKTLVGNIENIHHRDTITYQGKTMLSLRMELVSDLPQDVTDRAVDLTPEEMTSRLQTVIQSDPEYVAAQNIDGFSTDYSVTADKKLQVIVDIDFQKANLDEVEKLSFFKNLGLEDLKHVTPELFISGMKLNNLQEETNP